MSSSIGSSCLQGPHHEAQTSSSSTCPRYEDTVTDLPDMRCTVISGAGEPTCRPSPPPPPPPPTLPAVAQLARNAVVVRSKAARSPIPFIEPHPTPRAPAP